MSISYDEFYQWAVDRFGEANIKLRHTAHGTEICTHSLWSMQEKGKDDRKFHLWMNTEGGKKKIENGAYRCWITDHMGNLISLVSEVDGIPYDEAEELISDQISLRTLETKVSDLMNEIYGSGVVVDELPKIQAAVDLPENSFKISEMNPDDPWCIKATDYLLNRKLEVGNFYVCTENKDFGNRLVIPYYDRDGKIVFYNARSMNDKNELRYRKCDEVESDNFLYMTSWPRSGKIYVMEGEFDAESLKLSDLVGCACGGKHLSDTQIELLRPYIPVLAFDADLAGLEATLKIGDELLSKGLPVRYVRPPKVYKDWNKLLQVKGPKIVKEYIEKFERPYTQDTSNRLRMLTV